MQPHKFFYDNDNQDVCAIGPDEWLGRLEVTIGPHIEQLDIRSEIEFDLYEQPDTHTEVEFNLYDVHHNERQGEETPKLTGVLCVDFDKGVLKTELGGVEMVGNAFDFRKDKVMEATVREAREWHDRVKNMSIYVIVIGKVTVSVDEVEFREER